MKVVRYQSSFNELTGDDMAHRNFDATCMARVQSGKPFVQI